MKGALDDYGNSFLEFSGNLLVLDLKDVSNESSRYLVAQQKSLNFPQHDTFVRERLVDRSKPLDDVIKRNKL